MLTHDMIPPRINGYDIIATAPVARDSSCSVIIGRDLSRQLPKYMTALVNKESIANEPPEWFWGHYFDGETNPFAKAMVDFVHRVGQPRSPDLADLKRLEQRHEAD